MLRSTSRRQKQKHGHGEQGADFINEVILRRILQKKTKDLLRMTAISAPCRTMLLQKMSTM